MARQDVKARQIEFLQENLQTIRKLAGWSIDDLGERIGVTKQTISNIENKKTTMSLTQYIAIRSVLDFEIQEHPEDEVLSKSIALLLDEGTKLNKEDYAKIKGTINTIAAASAGGAEKTELANMFDIVVGAAMIGTGIGSISPIGIACTLAGKSWLKNVLQLRKQKDTQEEDASEAT